MSSSYKDIVDGRRTYRWPKENFFMPARCVGGTGGRAFLLCNIGEGKLVKEIGVYCDVKEKWIQGIRVTYTDDTRSFTKGEVTDSYHQIELDLGETIKQAAIWECKLGDNSVRIGRIKITTSKDQVFNVGKETTQQNESSVDVGSGHLAGFTGCCTVQLNMLGFIFLKPIERILISDVIYDGLRPTGTDKISPHELLCVTYLNDTPEVIEYDFTSKVDQTNSSSFTSSTTKQFPKKVTIRAKVPYVAKVGADIGWVTGETKSYEESSSYNVTMQWSLKGKLKPGQSVTCTATCLHGKADVDYRSRVTVAFEGVSERWEFNDRGTLHNSVFSFAKARASGVKVRTAEELASTGGTLMALGLGSGTLRTMSSLPGREILDVFGLETAAAGAGALESQEREISDLSDDLC